MRRWTRWTILAALAMPSAAWAQNIGRPAVEVEYERENAPEGEKKQKLLEPHRGKMLIFYFFNPNHADSRDGLKTVADVAKSFKEQGVVLITFAGFDNDQVGDLLRENDIDPEGSFAWTGLGVRNLFEAAYGITSHPMVYVIDPLGVTVWRGRPWDDLKARVEEAIQRTPPPASQPRYLDDVTRRAADAENKGELGEAYTLYKQIVQWTNDGASAYSSAKSKMDTLESKAVEWLKKARDLERDRQWDEACRIFANVAFRFDGTDVGTEAQKEVSRVNGDRRKKELIRNHTEEAKAQIRLDQARYYEEFDYYEEAREIYRDVMRDYERRVKEAEEKEADVEMPEKTAAIQEAEKALERIKSNESIQRSISKRRAADEADILVLQAERYYSMDMFDQSRELIGKILEEHPGTIAARRAEKLQAKLPDDAHAASRP
ncbi:MAG: hypothetical protein KDA32_13185 [Phycisphaerales bacterium]|nr:hypothetical protein [Phycisphaerales bacterium]